MEQGIEAELFVAETSNSVALKLQNLNKTIDAVCSVQCLSHTICTQSSVPLQPQVEFGSFTCGLMDALAWHEPLLKLTECR